METYKLKCFVENGVITLPNEFLNKFIEITICEIDEKPINPVKKSDLLSPVQIDTKVLFPYSAVDTSGYVFNREEANER